MALQKWNGYITEISIIDKYNPKNVTFINVDQKPFLYVGTEESKPAVASFQWILSSVVFAKFSTKVKLNLITALLLISPALVSS